MMNRLEALPPGSHTHYRAAGKLDGYDADIFASNVCGNRIAIQCGPLGLTISKEACRELIAHLSAAVEAGQNAGGADHE